MPVKEVAGKGTLFAVAISLITAGMQLIPTNFQSGLALLTVGVALIIVWAFLIDYEARREAVKTVVEEMAKWRKEKSSKP